MIELLISKSGEKWEEMVRNGKEWNSSGSQNLPAKRTSTSAPYMDVFCEILVIMIRQGPRKGREEDKEL